MKKQYRNTVKNYYIQKDGEIIRYFIIIDGDKVEVPCEIYKVYALFGNKERYFDDQYDKKYYIRFDDCSQSSFTPIPATSEEAAIQNINMQQLQKAIKKLDKYEEKLIWLLYIEGYTLRVASHILGISHATVFKHHRDLLLKLRKSLERG